MMRGPLLVTVTLIVFGWTLPAWAAGAGGTTGYINPATKVPGLLDCHAIGQVYDVTKGTCIQKPKAGATDLMAPLLGVNGSAVIDADTIEASMDDFGVDGTATKDKKKGSNDDETSNAACNNGLYTDGCEDGTKRLCSLIPDLPAPATPWGLMSLFACALSSFWYTLRRRFV